MFTFEESFKFLKNKGFNKKITAMDLYGSGEIADMILRASKIGIHQIWQKEASPTCRFGLMNSLNNFVKTRNKEINTMNMVLKNIRNGSFNKKLNKEFMLNLKNLKKFDKSNNKSDFYKSLVSLKNL